MKNNEGNCSLHKLHVGTGGLTQADHANRRQVKPRAGRGFRILRAGV